MDSTIGNQFFQRQSRNLPANGVEARNDDGIRGVIDDYVDPGGELERANIPSFAADDASLHLIVGERHGRDRSFHALLGGDPLNCQRDDFLCFTLGVPFGRLADLADLVCRIGLRFFLHPMHQLRFGVGGGNSGELLQAPFLFAEEFLELLLALSEGFFAVSETLDTSRRLALSLLEKIILAIELALAVLYLALFALDFFATAPDLDLPFLTELHQLFFAAEDGCLAQAFRFALCFANDSRGCLIGSGVGLLLPPDLSASAQSSAGIEKNRAGDNKQKYASCG